MKEIQETIKNYLISVDNAWRFLRQGDVDQAHKAARDADRWHDDLIKKIGPNGPRFEYVGNLIVGVRDGDDVTKKLADAVRYTLRRHGRRVVDGGFGDQDTTGTLFLTQAEDLMIAALKEYDKGVSR